MKQLRFFKCQHCGNVIVKLVDSSVPVICCGEIMQEILANTIDASQEKHLPVANFEGQKVEVKIGEVLHPMTLEHYISFIILETDAGYQLKHLDVKELPIANFNLENEKPLAIYSYCNLHGLWKIEL